MRKFLVALTTLSTLGVIALVTSPAALARAPRHATGVRASAAAPTIYDSTISPLPGSLESSSFAATETSEYGNQVTFAGDARVLDTVEVTLDSFACQSGQGYSASCSSTPGATFSEPVTLNIYDVGAGNAVGSLIVSDTQDFAIPYQPSADPNYATDCAPDVVPNTYFSNVSAFAGAWYDSAVDPTTGNPIGCEFGFASNITFDFGHVVLPNSVIYGIAYDTSNYGQSPDAPLYQVGGATPTGSPHGDATACYSQPSGCPYDGLNVANSIAPPDPTVGSDPDLGTAYLDSSYAPFYCDNGAGGTGTFRIDGNPVTQDCTGTGSPYNVGYSFSEAQGLCDVAGAEDAPGATVASTLTGTPPCTDSPYIIPAVQFTAVATEAAVITSASSAAAVAGTPFSFPITTTGVPSPTIMIKGKVPHGLTFAQTGNGSASITGTPYTTDRNGTYRFTLRASNLPGPGTGRSRQTVTITLTGGKSPKH